MFSIHELNADFKTSPHLFLGVIDSHSDPLGTQVCLVSDLEFVGNARFKLDNLFVYASIQSFVWKVSIATAELDYPEAKAISCSDLDVWPTIDKETRLDLANKYEIPYFSASPGSTPTKSFNSLVFDLFELGQDFVIPGIEPDYMSFEKYVELWKTNPIEIARSDQNLDLAIGSRNSLKEHIVTLAGMRQQNEEKDFTRVMLSRITDVITAQKFDNTKLPKQTQNYLTVMESLGVTRALVSDSQPETDYLRKKSKGMTYTVYFKGEKVG